MSDNFQSIQSGKGLLQDQYGASPIEDAMKRRAKKLQEKQETIDAERDSQK
jgi:hypothetical protein